MAGSVLAAWFFGIALAVLVLFQLALAAGAPWGALAMGGRYPGRFPPAMRIAALMQIVLYGAMGAIVFARAGLILPDLFDASRTAIWAVVALMGVALVLNVMTPSKWERRLRAPVALVLLATSLLVALGK